MTLLEMILKTGSLQKTHNDKIKRAKWKGFRERFSSVFRIATGVEFQSLWSKSQNFSHIIRILTYKSSVSLGEFVKAAALKI